jgi:hypothetical protein
MKLKSKKQPSILERFVRNTIIFYLLLEIVGYFSVSSYYNMFGIDVTDYFATEDYLNIFFKEFISLAIFPIILLILLLFLLSKEEKDSSYKKLGYNFLSSFTIEPTSIGFIHFKTSLRKTLIIFIIISIISIILYLFLFKIKNFTLTLMVAVLGVVFTFGAIYVMIRFHELKISKFYPLDLLVLLIITMSSWVVFYLSLISGHVLLSSKVNDQNMTFHFINGNVVKTSDSTLYLGKSKDYIFLYSKPGNKAFIYNRSRIEFIDKRNNKIMNKNQ